MDSAIITVRLETHIDGFGIFYKHVFKVFNPRDDGKDISHNVSLGVIHHEFIKDGRDQESVMLFLTIKVRLQEKYQTRQKDQVMSEKKMRNVQRPLRVLLTLRNFETVQEIS